MGSWNHTCAISNLHVTAGEEVVVFMLGKVLHSDSSFCYNNALYDVCPVPFYGKYDDYGGVDECHGFGLNIVVEAMRKELYRFGQGPNSSHDIPVNKETFDVKTMFEADHEGRLGIEEFNAWSGDSYDHRKLIEMKNEDVLNPEQQYELDRLASKLKKDDNFRPVTHVVIHGKIFKDIMEKWYIEDYVGGGKGNTGYDNNYVNIYFKDIENSIDEYIEKYREDYIKNGKNSLARRYGRSLFNWNDPCLAGRWMGYFSESGSSRWFLIDVNEYVNDYVEAEDWDGLKSFTREVLIASWVNSFMEITRKIWTKQCGAGSQNSEHLGYRVLANSVLSILDEEKREYGEYDDAELDVNDEEDQNVG